jgi:6-phosphogluconolactonase
VSERSTAEAATMIYVSNADSKEIYVMSLDDRNGAVDLVQKAPVPGTVMPLAISPNRRFLYASLRSTPFSVSTLAIDQGTGRLNLLSTVPLPDNMAYLSTDKTGRFLFGASYSGDKISINPISRQGTVQAQPVQVTPTSRHPHSIITDPSNTYLFAPSLGGDTVLQFKFDQITGRATPNTPPFVATRKGAGPRHIVFHPNGRFAYGTNELDATVNAYGFDGAPGTLTLVGTVSALPPDFSGSAPFSTADLHITPDGRFLYASERASNSLAGFNIDARTGAMASIGNWPTETQPRGFNIDPRGRHLLVVGQTSNSMTSYAINPESGALAPQHRFSMGKNPNWVEIIDIR